ncbi:EpsI family protein [Methylacidiphilales bacterium]|nr:EpsI family protein [Candidatus Methylacidiphilales bacterium]
MTQPLPVSTVPLPGKPATDPFPATPDPVPIWRSLVVVVLTLLVWMVCWTKPSATLLPQAGVIMELPSYVNGYLGTDAEVTEPEHRILPKDTEFARKIYEDYSASQDRIFCGIVLSGTSSQSIHRPEVCLKAQGWSIIDQEDIPIQLDSGHMLTVRNLTLQKTVSAGGKPLTYSA